MQQFFDDRELFLLFSFVVISVVLLVTMGKILAPVLASIVIAYLLSTPVKFLQKLKIPRLASVCIVYIAFLGIFFVAMFILWPLLFQQFIRLYEELPKMIAQFQIFLISLPEHFPALVTQTTVDGWVQGFVSQLHDAGRVAFAASVASLPGVIVMIVYVFLVPLMVFFFMKDHHAILKWCAGFLPKSHLLLNKVWQDIDKQIVNYIRGKVIECFIVGTVSYITFFFFGLNYALLLALLVGISVFIPYIGAIVVTIPVVLVAFFEWGLGPKLAYLIAAYGIIQALDGSVLVPVMFGEVVNLHPIAIIIAILVFGAWWGFWGVFFAIPLATVVKVMLDLRFPHARTV